VSWLISDGEAGTAFAICALAGILRGSTGGGNVIPSAFAAAVATSRAGRRSVDWPRGWMAFERRMT